ncbi:MAG: peroxiredoxin-like family protein [Bacteriovoracaceae bacterium]
MKLFKIIFFVVFTTQSIQSIAMTPDERKKLFQDSIQRLKKSGIEKRAPLFGEIFPDIRLGNKKISEWTTSGPLLLIVYRGGWCPYCIKQLKEIQTKHELLLAKKITVIAISPETSNEVKKTASRNGLSFKLVSDKDGEVLRKLGLVFRVEDSIADEYKSLGIDLAASQGNKKQELPIPATYLFGNDMKVKFAHIDSNYTVRPSLEEILKAIDGF